MPEEKKDVNQVASQATADAVDENGVPWKNRAKELERKFAELEERIQTVAEAQRSSVKPIVPQEEAEEKRKKLLEFVNMGPDAYMEKKLQEVEWNRQIQEAGDYLRSKKDLTDEDKSRLQAIETEYNLSGMPMQRARSAWKIFEQEMSNKNSNDSERKQKISQTQTEGTGKVVSQAGVTRKDLIKAFAAEQAKNGPYSDRSIELTGLLEDTRQ